MTILIPMLVLAVCVVCFWRAERIGRHFKSLNGGRLERAGEFGGDVRAYAFYLRLASMLVGLTMMAITLRKFVRF